MIGYIENRLALLKTKFENMNIHPKLFLFFIGIVFYSDTKAQYNCGCGTIDITSVVTTPSDPGCNIVVLGIINVTSRECVNNGWVWNTTPTGSSGTIYVGYSQNEAVPFSQVFSQTFYLPLSCASLGAAFLNFYPPGGNSCSQIVLPIEYMHIYQNKNELIWVTTSEVNNSYFSVEGSGDGVHWVALSTTDSKSTNSNEINEYSTIINARNINFVRIKQMDFDGKSSFSEIIKWRNSYYSTGNIIQINAIGGDNIVIPDFFLPENADMVILDITGKTVYIGKILSGSSTICLTQGQYFVGYFDQYSGFTPLAKMVVF